MLFQLLGSIQAILVVSCNTSRSHIGQGEMPGEDGSVWKEGISLGTASETSVIYFGFNQGITGSTNAGKVSAWSVQKTACLHTGHPSLNAWTSAGLPPDQKEQSLLFLSATEDVAQVCKQPSHSQSLQ